MPTYTLTLNLIKPGASDNVTPDPFNTNFDVIDAQIAALNAYKATIDGMVVTLQELSTGIGNANAATGDSLIAAKAYTDSQIAASLGNISIILDEINGEVV